MVSATVCSKVVTLLLFHDFFVSCCSHCVLRFCLVSLFCNMVLYFIPSFAIILLRKRDRELFFSSKCALAVM